MWDLLDEVIESLQTLTHEGRWSGLRRCPDCVTSEEISDTVLVHLDSDVCFKYITKGYVVGLCQRLVDGGGLVRVAAGHPESMVFKEGKNQFWRVVKGWKRNGWMQNKPPLQCWFRNFSECKTARFAVYTEESSMLYMYKNENHKWDRPVIGLCLSLFKVHRTGMAITLQHPHCREADVTWELETEQEAIVWERKLKRGDIEESQDVAKTYKEADPEKKNVVVIGGGHCGVKIAKNLERDFNVTLVDSKDFFENTPSVLRTFVDPEYQKFIHRSYASCLPNSTIITAKVQKLTRTHVLLEKQHLQYDFLVICTGSSYDVGLIKSDFTILPSRHCTIKATHRKLERARKVLIVGGGLVGVELAAEICYKYPTKKIILVESGSKILQSHDSALSEKVTSWLSCRNVEILTNRKVVEGMGSEFRIEHNGKVEVLSGIDLDFACCGVKPNSDFLRGNQDFLGCTDKNGFIKVDSHFRVPVQGCPGAVFAGGDVVSLAEPKLAQNAAAHATHITANIRSMTSGATATSWGPLSSTYAPAVRNHILVSLGPYDGMIGRGCQKGEEGEKKVFYFPSKVPGQ